MKSNLFLKIMYSVVILISISMLSCASYKNSSTTNETSEDRSFKNNESSTLNWGSVLRNVSGLRVSGSYPDLNVVLRGVRSFISSTDPLYVLDGVVLGRSFHDLDTVADPINVKNVRVLNAAEAIKYGMRASNGVIEITLK